MLRELCIVAAVGLICAFAIVGCSHAMLMLTDAEYASFVHDSAIAKLRRE